MYTDYSNIGPSVAFENMNASLRIVRTSGPYVRNAIQNKNLELFPNLYVPELTLNTTETTDNYIISDIDGYIPNIPNGTIFDHLSFYPLDWPDFHKIPIGGNVGPDNSKDIRQNPVTRLYSSKKENHLDRDSTLFKSIEEQKALELQKRKERINKPPAGYDNITKRQVENISLENNSETIDSDDYFEISDKTNNSNNSNRSSALPGTKSTALMIHRTGVDDNVLNPKNLMP